MDTDEKTINSVTEKIIGCSYKVGSKLGSGFMEKCYENALAYELRKLDLQVQQQVPIQVVYDEIIVGDYIADLVVEGCVLVELKSIQRLDAIHAAQCINYLAATKLPICLLINFGRRVEVKRIAGSTFPSSSVSICAPSVAINSSQQ